MASQVNPSAAAASVKERRRHPRVTLCVPVSVRYGDRISEGYTENLAYSGLLIQALTAMPAAPGPCDLTLYVPNGEIHARGRIVRLNARQAQFAVEIETLQESGEAFLALLMAPSGQF